MARKKKDSEDNNEQEMSLKDRIRIMKEKYNKEHKSNILQTYDEDDDLTLERLSSGILSLDLILGKGQNGYGFAKGRVHEIYGPESSGKSSIVIQTIVETQRNNGAAVLIDAEHAFDPSYAEKLGVDIDALLVCQPETAEQGYQVAIDLLEDDSYPIDLIIVDSVAAMMPNSESDGEMDDQQMGAQPRVNNKFMRKVVPLLGKRNATLLLINQIREKIGGYGNPETTTGGRGIRFAASTRLEVRRSEDVLDAGEKIGHIIKCKTVKNKAAAPHQVTHIRLDWGGKGFNREFCIVEQGILRNVIQKSGAWLYFEDQKWHGQEALIQELKNNEELRNKITDKIKESL